MELSSNVAPNQPGVPESPDSRSVSLAQACAALRKSRRTVYYLIKDGRLRTIRTRLGSQRVLVDSLKRYSPDRP